MSSDPLPPASEWSPPVMYDIVIDRYRAVSQADVDQMQKELRDLRNALQSVSVTVNGLKELRLDIQRKLSD